MVELRQGVLELAEEPRRAAEVPEVGEQELKAAVGPSGEAWVDAVYPEMSCPLVHSGLGRLGYLLDFGCRSLLDRWSRRLM